MPPDFRDSYIISISKIKLNFKYIKYYTKQYTQFEQNTIYFIQNVTYSHNKISAFFGKYIQYIA